jgi:Bacterial PH domain
VAGRQRRHEELDRYLLDSERLVTAVHQHWAKVAEPVGSAVAGGAAALWVDAHIDPALGVVSTVLWWGWFVLVARMLYKLAEWRHDWFVATDKRLLLFYGFITRRVSMMPLIKVTDMSYERSVPGRILGYGRFVMESAGQDQALHKVNWVPEPDHHYRVICAEIFGVADEEGVVVLDERDDDRWDEPKPPRGIPDPYAGWDDPRHGSAHGDIGGTPSSSLYRSPDLRARDRSADTGPIPIRTRRDWDDD